MATTLLDHTGAPLERKAAPVSGLSSPEPWFAELLGARSSSARVTVSSTSAMRVPAVKRAVDLISSTVANLPVSVMTKAEGGSTTPAPDHPATALVSDFANPWTPAPALREILMRDALTRGDGYALVVRDGEGNPAELHHLPAGSCAVELDELTREPFYRVSQTGGSAVHSWRDVLHVAAPSLDGVRGASPVSLGREAIGLALVLELHAAKLFGNGARPGGVMSFPKALGDSAAGRMREAFQRFYGADGFGQVFVAEEGGSYHPVTLTSTDAQFLELRQHQVREIASIFGVPATMLNDLSAATFSNAEALGQAFRDETILPWVTTWEGALRRVLLTEEERRTHTIRFDLDSLDRADLSAKADAIAKRRAAGVSTANEERRALNLPSHPQGEELGSPFTTSNQAPAQ
ncbi:phage portal protein [Methylobacterium ajmalii]|uniref:Phage portal protein n=1 Tax=Methylobacterium ajmalii TaxID=2738439 RepID=A0ABV0A808_9HYPH